MKSRAGWIEAKPDQLQLGRLEQGQAGSVKHWPAKSKLNQS
jgi:hypothetical protein